MSEGEAVLDLRKLGLVFVNEGMGCLGVSKIIPLLLDLSHYLSVKMNSNMKDAVNSHQVSCRILSHFSTSHHKIGKNMQSPPKG